MYYRAECSRMMYKDTTLKYEFAQYRPAELLRCECVSPTGIQYTVHHANCAVVKVVEACNPPKCSAFHTLAVLTHCNALTLYMRT